MKEEYFTKGVVKNKPDSYDNYEDTVDERVKKEIIDQSPSIDELIDSKNINIKENNYIEYEHVGPESHKYRGISHEEIDEQIHEQLKSQYPDQYPEYINSDVEGLRNAIVRAYEQHETSNLKHHESMNQYYKDRGWSGARFQTKDYENANRGYAGKDNLKTMPENKKQRGFRGLLRRLFKTEPELVNNKNNSDVDIEKITKGVLTKEELQKEIEQDKVA